MTRDIDDKIRQLEVVAKGIELDCDTQQLKESISVLGQLVEKDIISTPTYPTLLLPTLSIGKEGTDEGELKLPRGLAFDDKTELIYVVNSNQSTACINVFTVTGEYMDTFCSSGQFHCPIGIALSGDKVYLTDALLHCIFHFKLSDFQLVSRVGKEGSGKGEFSFPQQVTVASNGSVFVADCSNNRVVVMDAKLNYKRSIKHESMKQPVDVKLLGDKVYALSYIDNPCIHVFTLSGKRLRSFITCGEKATDQVMEVYSFCFDKQKNILICDFSAESIKVFSQEGSLLHTLGGSKDKEKRIKPRGIVITEKNELICVSYKTLFGVHIFF
ncbi:PEP-CTERM domain protein [Oopsacas minuta]|uniref:PEP-CTERM domain protein n=1 Tax=Oopsacas minuta TaxID=111878 RepID=A0AAV7KK14_9METZ|nr:PEP-CTERM domain protein [Oopsacas minuta]